MEPIINPVTIDSNLVQCGVARPVGMQVINMPQTHTHLC